MAFYKALILLALVACTANHALAHPTDDLPLEQIGIGSSLTLLKNIEIPAKKSEILLSLEAEYMWCRLDFSYASYDRVMLAGKKLTIMQSSTATNHFSWLGRVSLVLDSTNISLSCSKYADKDRMQNIPFTIGDFRAVLANTFSIQLAPARPF